MTSHAPPPAQHGFDGLPVHPALRRALAARGYVEPTPVQAAVVATGLAGRDLLVSARTGSGKTVAFGLLLAETLLGEAQAFGRAGPPVALVVAPTRELALQVRDELSWLLGPAGARVLACVGGMDPRREARALSEGAQVVVGTPGRLRDHLDRKNLSLAAVRALVLDEADEMLDMGFREELEAILGAAPAERRTLLFSATLPRPIVELARAYTREAARVAATPAGEAHADIAYRAHLVAPREREHAVVNVLRSLDPPSALVFRATREAVTHAASGLSERGFQVVAISGELTQAERIRALSALRDGRARVLVATDVAARGLDLPGVALVLHADAPRDAAALQHRSGRTGRAGRKGLAVLLASPPERARLERLLREVGVSAEWAPVPTAEEIRRADEARLGRELDTAAAELGEEDREAARRLLEGRDPVAVAAALARRLRAALPAPEELPETALAASQAPARRPPGAPRRAPPRDAPWFRVTLGREQRADPKWLLPLLCRRGGVTRAEIGRIVVLARETRFEVARQAAGRFEVEARRPDPRAREVRIEPSSAPSARAAAAPVSAGRRAPPARRRPAPRG
jgi:ATP-dependent RNA helicase DeaD